MTKTLVLLGAAGDLTSRLLLPGLAGLVAGDEHADLLLVGSDRADWSDDDWRQRVSRAFEAAGVRTPQAERVVTRSRYHRADATNGPDLERLVASCEPPVALYFALPPGVTIDACQALAQVGVPDGTRLVMEKPFGTDAASAESLDRVVTSMVPEEAVHRVDHFLGMATVLNVLGLRFANRVVEPLLTGEHVAAVEVVFEESLGLEGRAGFYDGAGALVDMLQSHLLQVLALVAMSPPGSLEPADVRDGKAQTLRATSVWAGDPERFSRRARYTAGDVDGRRLPSYVDEEGVDPARGTETLADVVLTVDTWRWAGVPFRLRSGKALGSPRQEVAVTFRDPPRVPSGFAGRSEPNRLRIGLGSRRRVALDLTSNGEGHPFDLEALTLGGDFGAGELLEYGEVLRGVLEGDPALSVRGDTSVQCWRIVEPVVAAWRSGAVPLDEYAAGSRGPRGWDMPAR